MTYLYDDPFTKCNYEKVLTKEKKISNCLFN
jgi:hypothetical protein